MIDKQDEADDVVTPASDVHGPNVRSVLRRYWRKNLVVMTVLLLLWAVVGLGCGVLLAGALNRLRLGGFPLGFWFAQQGSIIGFVGLILIYCLVMNHLDKKHHREIDQLIKSSSLQRSQIKDEAEGI